MISQLTACWCACQVWLLLYIYCCTSIPEHPFTDLFVFSFTLSCMHLSIRPPIDISYQVIHSACVCPRNQACTVLSSPCLSSCSGMYCWQLAGVQSTTSYQLVHVLFELKDAPAYMHCYEPSCQKIHQRQQHAKTVNILQCICQGCGHAAVCMLVS